MTMSQLALLALLAAAGGSVRAATVPTVTAAQLDAVRHAIQQSNHYDLAQVRAMLPRIFNSEAARTSFFAEWATGENFSIHDQPYVHDYELRHFAGALADYGGRAARRHEWRQSEQALELAVDVVLLLTRLTPPERVVVLRVKGQPDLVVARWQSYYHIFPPIASGMGDLLSALQPVAASSARYAACLRPVTHQIERINGIMRHDHRQWPKDLRIPSGTPNPRADRLLRAEMLRPNPRAVRLFRAQVRRLRQELLVLRRQIPPSMGCLAVRDTRGD